MRKKTEKKILLDKPLCLYKESYIEHTMLKLREVNDSAYRFGQNVEIDLSEIPFISAAASLLLFAIVNRAQLCLRDEQTIRITLPTRKKNLPGYTWVVSTGLAKALLASDFEKIEELTQNERYYQSSVDPYAHHLTTAQMLNRKAASSFSKEQLSLLESGISEAMLNVSHHAYDSPEFNELTNFLGGKRWWQCAWFDPELNTVVFIICDLGMGIAKSFLGTEPTQPFMQISLVVEAWTLGATRTGLNWRGNGSEDIKSPVGAGCTENEKLLILSGHARYMKTSNDEKPSCTYTNDAVPGTLVQWSLVPTGGGL